MTTTLERGALALDGRVLLTLEAPDEQPAGVHPQAWVERRGEAWELGLDVVNEGSLPARVEVLDALVGRLAPRDWGARWFSSAWGAEFEPHVEASARGLAVATRSGRSSHGAHPLVAFETGDAVVLVAVAWSGNWRIEVDGDGVLRAGISPLDFFVDLEPGERLDATSVFVAAGRSLGEAGARLAGAASGILPRTPWSDAMPTEWNHWWPYEDQEIDEATFLAQTHRAVSLGIEAVTLDAGWFGRTDSTSEWPAERGDWDQVNTARFPHGIAALADAVRAEGAEFGIWLEAEAVGARAALRADRPDLLATRPAPDGASGAPLLTVSLDEADPTFLGYVCLGSAAGRAFVAEALDAVVGTTGARWVKLDFNVDPGSGCSRTDHGHGAGDGLLRHYQGLYRVLDEFRARHPEVILESCSSGGLRTDLGLARHVHCHFLSDPDWTEHHLQVLWGASLMLPPDALLHWTWSQWRGDNPDQRQDLATLGPDEFDRQVRAAMLHRLGVSMRLTELPDELADRLAVHVRAFREVVAPLLPGAVLRPLTDQPRRHGEGCRRPAFQLDSGEAHLLACFALDETDARVTLAWRDLDADRRYDVTDVAGDEPGWTATGAELMAGIERTGASWLLLARASSS